MLVPVDRGIELDLGEPRHGAPCSWEEEILFWVGTWCMREGVAPCHWETGHVCVCTGTVVGI